MMQSIVVGIKQKLLILITSDPENDLPAAILEYEPDFIGVSVRNAYN